MKKTILVSLAAVAIGGGFSISASAQDIDCGDLVWSAEQLANTPNVGDYCLEIVDRGGQPAAKFHARVVRQSVNSTIVQWQAPDGSWSPSDRTYPPRGFKAHIGGQEVKISDLPVRQEINVYVLSETDGMTHWSVAEAAPVAAAAAAPVAAAAAPEPAPEPEPAPVMLPKTATQAPVLALLGGLVLLLGGAVGFLRSRL
jgi:LPXTG-motif cell wall-anchored protein